MARVYIAKILEQECGETYTAKVERNGAGWLGCIQELPEVSCAAKTKEILLKTLETTLQETLVKYDEAAAAWDKQFAADVKAGKLAQFAAEALADFRDGKCEEI